MENASYATPVAWNKVSARLDLNLEINAHDVKSVSRLQFDEWINRLFKNHSDIVNLKKLLDKAEKTESLQIDGVLYPEVKSAINQLSQQYKLFVVSNC